MNKLLRFALFLGYLLASSLVAQTPTGPISSTMFGLNLQGFGVSNWPTVSTGAGGKVGGVSWVYVENNAPVSGVHTYDWSRMDNHVATALAHGQKMFWETDYIPRWAAADVSTCTYNPATMPAGSGCTGMVASSHLADYQSFLTTMITRYQGKIDMYGLWNEPYNASESTLTPAELVTLTNMIHDTVRSLDPGALIGSPTIFGLAGITYINNYYNAGGTTDVDVVTTHGESGSTHPESIQGGTSTNVRSIMAAHGLASKPLWDTEAEPGATVSDMSAFVAVYYILHWNLNIPRLYWYGWDTGDNGSPLSGTPAATAYQQVYNWMVGATMSACSLNGGTDINNSLYTCDLTRSGATKRVVWHSGGASTYTVPAGYIQYTDLSGAVHAIVGSAVPVGNAPILLNKAANTYYVSFASGADTNTGTDAAHPWKTLGKVTAGPTGGGYNPGDTIKFNRGETWTSATFNTHDSGVSGNTITYTNYGTGALPILDGGGTSVLMNINHNFITVTGLQFQNAGTFIHFAGMDGTTITGNTMLNATNHFIYAGFGIAGTTVVTSNTLTVQAGHAGGNNSIEIWGDSRQAKSYTVSDNTIDRHLSNNPNANCIVLAGTSNVLIERNICRGGTQGPGVKPYQNPSTGANCAAGDPGTNNIKIRGNYVGEITTANNGDGELIEGEGCDNTNQQTNLEVAYNNLVCASGGVGVGSSDAIGAFHNNGYDIHGNVIIGGCQSGWPANQNPTTTPGMIRINAASTNVHVHNNTLVGGMPTGDARPQHGIGYFPGSAGVAENNILKNLNTGVLCSGCGTVSADHNLFDTDVTRNYSSGVTDNGNNLNVSPKFVGSTITTAEDVKLQTGSPAINSGVALGTGFKFILDPNGTGPLLYSGTYDQSSGWMRGAFGFTGQSPPAITGFVANPSGISTGGSSQLTCTATNFTSLAITPGVGNVSSGVPVTVSPSTTTQYDCRATNTASFVDAFATVTVNAPAPVITGYTTTPAAIITGQSSTLQWTSTGGATCTLDQGIGAVACNGSRVVSPTITTPYKLTVTNSSNVSVSQTKTVAVNVPTAINGAVMQGAIIP